MGRRVLICSAPRSGTHFLANSICFNITNFDNYRILIPGILDLNLLKDFIINNECKRFYKSHHEFIFEPILNILLDLCYIFYIYRDGRDVLCSQWNYYNHIDKAPHCSTVGQFIREDPKKI